MVSVTENWEQIAITHDGLTFTFEKLEDRLRFQYAGTAIGGGNSERTPRYDFPEYADGDVDPIPQPVLDELDDRGYEY